MSNTKHHSENAEIWFRHFVADVLSARAAQRTAIALVRKGYSANFVTQARALRDAHLASARNSLLAFRAAAKSTT